MNATAQRSFHSDHSSQVIPVTEDTQKSRSNVLPQNIVADDAFKEWFVQSFARYLQANFRNPEHVAAAFGRRYQTALNWWNAENKAAGEIVGLVFLTMPDAVAFFLAEWHDR